MNRLSKSFLAVLVCLAMNSAPLLAAGDKTTDLSADVLEYDTTTGIMHATGSVKMIQDGAVLTGAEARYNSKTQEGVVTGGVVLVKGDMNMQASQVATQGDNHLVATGNVVATKGNNVLTGPQVDYYSDREYAVVPSNARVTMPDGTMTADYLESYTKENRVTGQGNVHIVSETKQIDATGDRADYFGDAKGKVILSGNAVAVQGVNTLRGNTLTLYLADESKTPVTK